MWYRSAYFNEFRRPLRQDDMLYSHLPLPRYGCASGFGFVRQLGDPPFSEADRKLLHLFHRELRLLWATPAMSNKSPGQSELSPRLKQTLNLLRTGRSEKQVAVDLRLSQHTVHDYVKELHRRFGANSLGELLARARPAPCFRPNLGLEGPRADVEAPGRAIAGSDGG